LKDGRGWSTALLLMLKLGADDDDDDDDDDDGIMVCYINVRSKAGS